VSTLFRLWAAWLRWLEDRRDQAARPADRDVVAWLDQLGPNPDDVRDAKAAVDRAMQVYERVLNQLIGCSCPDDAIRVVVIHGHGTYCGDQQFEQVEAVLTEQPFPSDGAVAVLDALRGDHRG
jgi:hypothetical protein